MMTDGINGPFFLSGSNRESPFVPGQVGRLNTATIVLRCIMPAEWRAPILEKFLRHTECSFNVCRATNCAHTEAYCQKKEKENSEFRATEL
jgi:hypothetical protein